MYTLHIIYTHTYICLYNKICVNIKAYKVTINKCNYMLLSILLSHQWLQQCHQDLEMRMNVIEIASGVG